MCTFQQKITRYAQEKIQHEETKQPLKRDSDTAQILEFPYQEFEIIMIAMLKSLMGKVGNMQK